MSRVIDSDVIIIGAGLAGVSAAIYLGRAGRKPLVVHSGRSMARWEPDVQNYLGFPEGVGGEELLKRGRSQARRYHARFRRDEIGSAKCENGEFLLSGHRTEYRCRRLLLATGIFHIPPDIPGIHPCLGHSLFFCKDCDAYRVRGKDIAVYGWSNETVEYALSMLSFSPCVAIVTDGRKPHWDSSHATWIREYEIPLYLREIVGVERSEKQLMALAFKDGAHLLVSSLFTTRGDVYLNSIARALNAGVNEAGEIVVDLDMRTSVPGLFAAGCVTPANCQMIVAAGQGAVAAQAINRELFLQSLATHSLRRFRRRQLKKERTRPAVEQGACLSGSRRGAG